MSDFSIGYNMYTIPSDTPKELLKKIMKEDIIGIKLSSKEIKDMEFCNLDENSLIGYYYDKSGNIYFEVGLQFKLKIKYFKELYVMNKKQN